MRQCEFTPESIKREIDLLLEIRESKHGKERKQINLRLWRLKNYSRERNKRREQYLEIRECRLLNERLIYHEMKNQIFNFYGRECGKYKEQLLESLVIDHVNNDAMSIRGSRKSTTEVMRFIVKNNFPDSFQILCQNCNFIKELNRKRSIHSRDRLPVNLRRSRQNLKVATMNQYGNKCICCGIDNIDLLAIDHVNGNGCKHRKELEIRGGGSEMYKWLRDNNYPDGYQILCHSCNFAKGTKLHCPHRQKETNR